MNKNGSQLKALIRDIIQNHRVSFGKHCREDRMPGRSVYTDDFLKVLSWGEIISSEWQDTHKAYKCTITGEDVEGEKLTLVVAVSEAEFKIRCITVY